MIKYGDGSSNTYKGTVAQPDYTINTNQEPKYAEFIASFVGSKRVYVVMR